MANGNVLDSTRRTASDKILRNKAFSVAKNPKYDGYQSGFASMVYNFIDKKSALLADKSVSDGAINTENVSNKKLSEKLHKSVIKKSWEKKSTLTFYRQYLGC